MAAHDDVETHNKEVLMNLVKGDLIEIKRGLYSHWAVFIGDGKVIHLAGDEDDGSSAYVYSGSVFTISGKMLNKASVKRDDFWKVTGNCKAKKNNSKDLKMSPFTAEEIVDRAKKMLGKKDYNILWYNCEHFANYCRYGKFQSDQADKVFVVGKFTVEGAAILVDIRDFIAVADKGSIRDNFAVFAETALPVVKKAVKLFGGGEYPVGGLDALAVICHLIALIDKIFLGGKFDDFSPDVLAAVYEVIADADKGISRDQLVVVVIDVLIAVLKVKAHAAKGCLGVKFAVVCLAGIVVVKGIPFVMAQLRKIMKENS